MLDENPNQESTETSGSEPEYVRTTAGVCPTCHADVHGHVYRARGTSEHGWICPVCDEIHDPDEVDESGADGELVADGGKPERKRIHRVPDRAEFEAARDDLEAVEKVESAELRPKDDPFGIFVSFDEYHTPRCIMAERRKHGLYIDNADLGDDGRFGLWLVFGRTEGDE